VRIELDVEYHKLAIYNSYDDFAQSPYRKDISFKFIIQSRAEEVTGKSI